jgi:hypothetical protein
MSRLPGLALAILLAVAGSASATPVTWTLNDVTFTDGATAFGSFVYDADANTVSDVSITTSATPLYAGNDYLLSDPGFGPAPNFFVVVTGVLADYTGTGALALGPAMPMTNAGGTILLDLHSGGEFTCSDAGCTNGIFVRAFASGSISAPSAPSVPEPATISLLLTGLLGFGIRRARKTR